jgi:hypothetical protein
MGDTVDEEFAALEAAEPAGRFEIEDDDDTKDIDPYEPEDDRNATHVADVIKPQIHEFSGNVLFAPFESEPDVDGIRPYFAIVSAFEPDLEAEVDGGLARVDSLGGLSRLDEVFVEYDVDTALLAFGAPDRAEFFGALDACYEHGVTSTEPEAKLRYDIGYIRRQSFWFDLQIVTRQLWQVLEDPVVTVRGW